MKIIDLLNKIANGEEVPKKFIIKGSCFKDLYFEYNEKYNCYDLIGENFENGCYVFGYSELNDEIEIIEKKEDKKIPEKSNIDFNTKLPVSGCSENEAFMMTCISHLGKTIDSLIDYLKSKGE